MKIKIKKLCKKAIIPYYSRPGDAGMDITAISVGYEDGNVVYGTGLSIQIPEGYVGLIFPRSSISKYDMILTNHVGVIDSNFRGQILCKFKKIDNIENDYFKIYKEGDRIAQLIIVPIPYVDLIEVDELSETQRGADGFGSSGN